MEDVELDELPRPDFIFKVIVVGDKGVGKTAFFRRFLDDIYYRTPPRLPIGVHKAEEIMIRVREPYAEDDMLAKLLVWDTENPDELEAIIRVDKFCNKIGVVLCYDINDEESFRNVERWMKTALRVDRNIVKVIVGLKSDKKKAKRQVLTLDGKELTTKHGLRFLKTSSLPFPHFHEVSSKTGENVENAFLGLTYRMMKMSMDLPPMSSKYSIEAPKTEVVSGGLVLEEDSDGEGDWREEQTRRDPPEATRLKTPPPPDIWPDEPMVEWCRDVAGLTLAEYERAKKFNWCDGDMGHLPFGWPNPPKMEPVWWWKGWGTKWGRETRDYNKHSYVENWFYREKHILRRPFKIFFGTLQSEALKEFSTTTGGPTSLLDAFQSVLGEDKESVSTDGEGSGAGAGAGASSDAGSPLKSPEIEAVKFGSSGPGGPGSPMQRKVKFTAMPE